MGDGELKRGEGDFTYVIFISSADVRKEKTFTYTKIKNKKEKGVLRFF